MRHSELTAFACEANNWKALILRFCRLGQVSCAYFDFAYAMLRRPIGSRPHRQVVVKSHSLLWYASKKHVLLFRSVQNQVHDCVRRHCVQQDASRFDVFHAFSTWQPYNARINLVNCSNVGKPMSIRGARGWDCSLWLAQR